MTDDITLNISSSVNVQPRKYRNHHVRGIVSRKRRIEERRKLKKRILKFGQLETEKSDAGHQMITKDEGKVPSLKTKEENVTKVTRPIKRDNHTQMVKTKSIFSGNPDIPELDLPKPAPRKVKKVTPINKFIDLDIHPGLKSYIVEKMELEQMTPVQAAALPVLLEGQDALIRSQTGSGKTLAYALSVIQTLQEIKPEVTRQNGPMAIVLTPTRELAQQSYAVFQQLTLPIRRLVATWLVGGQNRKSEKARIRKGVNIIVSTPGRFVDHLENTSCLNLENIKWLVFDEADRLLDMGFQKDINKVLKEIKKQTETKPQTVLLSATLNRGVENLVDLTLTSPAKVDVNDAKGLKSDSSNFVDPSTGLEVEKVSLPEKLQQHVVVVPSKLRLISLFSFIMEKVSSAKILVFLSCRDSVEFHFHILKLFLEHHRQTAWAKNVFQLHGGMAQKDRTETMIKFKKSKLSVLLCTDVAARGLDIPRVDWVVQYTSPGSPVDYIHRVGRTARAGQKGNAVLFLTPVEVPYVKLLTSYDIDVSELKLDQLLTGLLSTKSKNFQENVRIQMAKEKAAETHKTFESFIQEDKNLKELSVKAFVSFIRAYATYPLALKHIFHVKNLHTGHVAKSFALQDTPGEALKSLQNTVGQRAVQQMQFKRKQTNNNSKNNTEQLQKQPDSKKTAPAKSKVPPKATKRHPIVAKFDLMSEFSSGMEGVTVQKKMKV
uniref:ATP-dependent RNA helicase n=1 Tax=Phallusia mammillata TaxID=59560 RepID=A0A6F9DBC6_9ASCI|nr:probable ATP-dependent RNA helicase DDX31 [Phallusia mammillata]